jgi:hypothetical protein
MIEIIICFTLGLLGILFIVGLLWFSCLMVGHIAHKISRFLFIKNKIKFYAKDSPIETGMFILFMVISILGCTLYVVFIGYAIYQAI